MTEVLGRETRVDDLDRETCFDDLLREVRSLLDGEDDWVAAMATVASAVHHCMPYYHWTGFYRRVSDDLLVIGPYQGGHGCLRIPFDRGVCGAAARTRQTQLVPDVHAFPGHIACSATTQSELVVPVITPSGDLLAVLDIDSDLPDAFDALDQSAVERVCALLGEQFHASVMR